MDQLTHVEAIIVGSAGTFVTEFLRLKKIREELSKPLKVSWEDLIWSAGYVLCGGFCAFGLSSFTIQSAFYVGLTWPVTVGALVKHRKKRTMYLANSKDIVPVEKPHPGALDAARATWFKSALEAFRNHADGLFL